MYVQFQAVTLSFTYGFSTGGLFERSRRGRTQRVRVKCEREAELSERAFTFPQLESFSRQSQHVCSDILNLTLFLFT